MSGGDSLTQLRIIWGAMVGATVVYTTVVYVLMVTETVDMAAFGPDLMNIIGAMATLQMVAGVVLRRHLVSAIPDDASPETRRSRYGAASVTGLAFTEGGGLLVITLGLLTGSATWVLAGGGAAAVLMLMLRPSEEEMGA